MAHPVHTTAAFDHDVRRRALGWLRQVVTEIAPDAIVACGQSGLIIGGILSSQLDIPIVAVRKEWEKPRGDGYGAHANFRPEGEEYTYTHAPRMMSVHVWDPYRRYVFLDDLISSGVTMHSACKTAYQDQAVTKPYPDAIVLYRSSLGKGQYEEFATFNGGLVRVPVYAESF